MGLSYERALDSVDPATLLYTCGCLQNLCDDEAWANAFDAEAGVQQRLEVLTLTHGDERVVHYASGALTNLMTRFYHSKGDDAFASLSAEAHAVIKRRGFDAQMEALQQPAARRRMLVSPVQFQSRRRRRQ